MSVHDISICKAIIQQGEKAGKQCQRNITENEYCVYHQRNYLYDTLIKEGKKLCNMFFRGCNNELSNEDIDRSYKNCIICRQKKSGKSFNCQYKDCTFKIKTEEEKYCKKHIRQILYDNELKESIKYCDISRGCFNKIIEGVKCDDCKTKEKIEISSHIDILRLKYNIIPIDIPIDTISSLKQEEIPISVSELWRSIQKGAYNRELLFTITEIDFEKLAIQPCYYCGFYSKSRLNGIDRIDNNKGYILNNCITCCKMCNIIKNTQHPNEFLDKVESIINNTINKKEYNYVLITKWPSYQSKKYNDTYKNYTSNAKLRNIEMLLKKDEYNILLGASCYLCGIPNSSNHQNGIDRIDNSIRAYTIDNSKTCCGHCNLMKGTYTYSDFIDKCIQINKYNCNRTIFNTVPIYDNTKCRNEFYTAEDIFAFMTEGKYMQFLEWCKGKKKTPEFITEMNIICNLDTLSIKNKDLIISQIRNKLEKERNRQYSDEITNKNIQCTTLYSYLINGKEDIFIKWFDKHYTKTSLFEEQFNSLLDILPSLNKQEGIKACQKFMYDEKNRRNIQLRRATTKKIIKYSNTIIKPLDKDKLKSTNIVIIPTNKDTIENKIKIIQSKTGYEKKIITEIKQWKVKQIYEAIITNNENTYREYCEKNNDIDKIENWNTYWAEFVCSVKGKSIEDAEIIIKEFIQNLTRLRHNKICYEKNSKLVDREDRQKWPSISIIRAFQDNKLYIFKKHTEEQTGENPDNPTWQKRWNTFVEKLEENKDDPDKLKNICSLFLTAQRTKRYRTKPT
jgi:hypothetical protein